MRLHGRTAKASTNAAASLRMSATFLLPPACSASETATTTPPAAALHRRTQYALPPLPVERESDNEFIHPTNDFTFSRGVLSIKKSINLRGWLPFRSAGLYCGLQRLHRYHCPMVRPDVCLPPMNTTVSPAKASEEFIKAKRSVGIRNDNTTSKRNRAFVFSNFTGSIVISQAAQHMTLDYGQACLRLAPYANLTNSLSVWHVFDKPKPEKQSRSRTLCCVECAVLRRMH